MALLENLAAIVVLIGLIMYAVFAGADFGGGVWTALASGPRAKEQRESLFQAIGPVWETNHVWLIFVVVALFAAFPKAFQAMFTALLVPFVIALIGINFRGAAYAFRHYGSQVPHGLPATVEVFSISSIVTPFFMGMAVTATAAGHILIEHGQVQRGLWDTWINPFTLVGGIIGLGVCAYITPIFMSVRTHGKLQDDFRKRGIAAALFLGLVSALEIPIAWWSSPLFFQRLSGVFPILFMVLAVIFGLVTLFLLIKEIFRWAQITAAATIALVFTGFAAALYPDLLIGQLTIFQAAAPQATLLTFLLSLPIGVLILAPSLYLLYQTFSQELNPEITNGVADQGS